jgi:hypothetical protein
MPINQPGLYAKVLLSIGKFLARKCSICNASYTFGAERQGDVMP